MDLRAHLIEINENLFDRPKAMNLPDWEAGANVLADYARLNSLIDKSGYAVEDKDEMVEILLRLGLKGSDEGPFVILRQNRGRLLKRSKGAIEIVAGGRDDWVGCWNSRRSTSTRPRPR